MFYSTLSHFCFHCYLIMYRNVYYIDFYCSLLRFRNIKERTERYIWNYYVRILSIYCDFCFCYYCTEWCNKTFESRHWSWSWVSFARFKESKFWVSSWNDGMDFLLFWFNFCCLKRFRIHYQISYISFWLTVFQAIQLFILDFMPCIYWRLNYMLSLLSINIIPSIHVHYPIYLFLTFMQRLDSTNNILLFNIIFDVFSLPNQSSFRWSTRLMGPSI